MRFQGFPHGDGDCAAPGCDCGKAPCGFYLWNHSSTAVVHNQTFQQWFINDYMLNKVGMSPLVSGFFWDDFWPAPGSRFPDASPGQVDGDTGTLVVTINILALRICSGTPDSAFEKEISLLRLFIC